MKSFCRGLLVLCLALSAFGCAQADVRVGLQLSTYPDLVPVPGYPVYYAPRLSANYFFYDNSYWLLDDDGWYRSDWYDGPWDYVEPDFVPVYVLRVPVRYYRAPPPYFRGWYHDAPPRWGFYWGSTWERRHYGWDRWDRNRVPPRAPLPHYPQRHPDYRNDHRDDGHRNDFWNDHRNDRSDHSNYGRPGYRPDNRPDNQPGRRPDNDRYDNDRGGNDRRRDRPVQPRMPVPPANIEREQRPTQNFNNTRGDTPTIGNPRIDRPRIEQRHDDNRGWQRGGEHRQQSRDSFSQPQPRPQQMQQRESFNGGGNEGRRGGGNEGRGNGNGQQGRGGGGPEGRGGRDH